MRRMLCSTVLRPRTQLRSISSNGIISVASKSMYSPVKGLSSQLSCAAVSSLHFPAAVQFNSRRSFAHYDKPKNIEVYGVEDEAPQIMTEKPHVDHVGFDLMIDRTTRIMIVLAQRMFFVVLQTHVNTRLADFLEGATNFNITGCTDCPEVEKEAKARIEYSDVKLVNYKDKLPYSHTSFQFIVHLIPCPNPDPLSTVPYVHPTMVPSPPLSEIARVLNVGGYAVIGAAKQVWESENMLDQIFELEAQKEISFMSMQMLPLDRPMDFTFKEYSTENQPTQSDLDWESKEEMYVLCTVRKL